MSLSWRHGFSFMFCSVIWRFVSTVHVFVFSFKSLGHQPDHTCIVHTEHLNSPPPLKGLLWSADPLQETSAASEKLRRYIWYSNLSSGFNPWYFVNKRQSFNGLEFEKIGKAVCCRTLLGLIWCLSEIVPLGYCVTEMRN